MSRGATSADVPGAADAGEGWRRELDALEASLERRLSQLRSGALPEVDGWRPPDLEGPLPVALHPQARRIVALADEVQSVAEEALEGLTAERVDVGRRRSAGQAYASDGSGSGGRM